MIEKHCYLLVEGPLDVFFIGRILEELGLSAVRTADQLPPRWRPFLDNVLARRDSEIRAAGKPPIPFWQMFKPACLINETHKVLVEAVGGNRTKFANALQAANALIDGGLASLNAVGFLPDADRDPNASLSSAQRALASAGLSFPDKNQEVSMGKTNSGIFLIPGGDDHGGLEEILIACAEAVYPSLSDSARQFVGSVNLESDSYTDEDRKDLMTPQGPVKAIVGSIASVLKPGSTIQVSVLRDRWVSKTTIAIPRVAALVTFLKSLCEM